MTEGGDAASLQEFREIVHAILSRRGVSLRVKIEVWRRFVDYEACFVEEVSFVCLLRHPSIHLSMHLYRRTDVQIGREILLTAETRILESEVEVEQ